MSKRDGHVWSHLTIFFRNLSLFIWNSPLHQDLTVLIMHDSHDHVLCRIVNIPIHVACRANFSNDGHITWMVTARNQHLCRDEIVSCHFVSGYDVTFHIVTCLHHHPKKKKKFACTKQTKIGPNCKIYHNLFTETKSKELSKQPVKQAHPCRLEARKPGLDRTRSLPPDRS